MTDRERRRNLQQPRSFSLGIMGRFRAEGGAQAFTGYGRRAEEAQIAHYL